MDALLDDFLLDVHSKNDEELCVLRGGIYEDDIPKSVAGVFNELRNVSALHWRIWRRGVCPPLLGCKFF